MRSIRLAGVFACLAFIWTTAAPLAHQAADQDASALLAQAREALGGDAALSAVTSFTVDGSWAFSAADDGTLVYSCVLPDKFIRESRASIRGPFNSLSQVRRIEGFNGDDVIDRTISPDPALRFEIGPGSGEAAFVELTLAMFAASFPPYPLTFAKDGVTQLPGGPADVIVATGRDGRTWRLTLDEKTHLPATVGDGHFGRVTLGDYKRANGLTWPHRLAAGLGKSQDIHLGTYKINPKIDPKTFTAAK